MSKKRRNISGKRYNGSDYAEASKEDRSHVSLSVSLAFLNDVTSPEVTTGAKSKIGRKKLRKSTKPVITRKFKTLPRAGIPEDAAVHFGNFYCLEKKTANNGADCRKADTSKSELPVRDSPRSEFTRQMVHKLERLAGTEHYARQISALLEETVESPNFVVKQPPDDNFLPYERSNSQSYPLWYKEPENINYESQIGNSSASLETKKEDIKMREMLAKSARSDCTLTNSTITTESGFSFEDYDDEINEELPLFSSSVSRISDENMESEDDEEYEEVKVAIVVK